MARLFWKVLNKLKCLNLLELFKLTLTLQKLRTLLVDPAIGEIRGVKGEAVVNYREPLTILQRRINSGDSVSSTFPTCLAIALAKAGG